MTRACQSWNILRPAALKHNSSMSARGTSALLYSRRQPWLKHAAGLLVLLLRRPPEEQIANGGSSPEDASPVPAAEETQPSTTVAEEKCPACKPEDESKPLDSDKESWVRCDACKVWFHWRCVGGEDDLSVIDKWCALPPVATLFPPCAISRRHNAYLLSLPARQVLQPMPRERPLPHHNPQTSRPQIIPQKARPRLRQPSLRCRLIRSSKMARNDARQKHPQRVLQTD